MMLIFPTRLGHRATPHRRVPRDAETGLGASTLYAALDNFMAAVIEDIDGKMRRYILARRQAVACKGDALSIQAR